MTSLKKTIDFTGAKKAEIANLEYGLFASLYQQAHDIEKLKTDPTEALVAEIDKELAACTEILNENIKGRVSAEQKDARVKAGHKGLALQGKRTKLLVAKSDKYKKIAERAIVIQGYRESIAFVTAFDGTVPHLPFLDIEGTKYKTNELGGYVKDADGNKELYLSNDKGIVSKKG